jgi:type I restriction enzyme M protein
MTAHQEHTKKTKELIDGLKTVCGNYGLANTGYEYKIITEAFLYKFLNDKFLYEARRADPALKDSESVEADIRKLKKADYEYLLEKLGTRAAKFKKEHLLGYLFNKQNEAEFAELFDTALVELGQLNIKLFSVSTITNERIVLFEKISNYIVETNQKTPFCRALINKLAAFSFEPVFAEKYDFFSTVFEYLIKDYNKDSGQYAEYYTPRAVAKIMAAILAPTPVKSVELYDPAAGSGSLLLSLAHQIGENKCTIYSQDISQKSSEFLRLNLILNNLVHSLHNVVKGNSLTEPFHKDGKALKRFDYVVSNPPFKTDFSDDRETLAADIYKARFFAGVPKIPAGKKESMAIYLMFIQHILYSLNDRGKAAVVVPTGFLTAGSGIEIKIRKLLVDKRMLRGVVSMPSNIFANTGTNVSILFIDKSSSSEGAVLLDASKLGTKVKEGKNQKTVLSDEEENCIIETFNAGRAQEDFTVVVPYADIAAKNYSFSAGQYFDVKIEYSALTPKEFEAKMAGYKERLAAYFAEGKKLEKEIQKRLIGLKYE